MVDTAVHTLSALFAVITATGAGFLSILYWHTLRESPFGMVIALLTLTMSAMIMYHIVLFLLEPDTLILDTLRSGLYTAIAIFLWLVVATHQRIKNSAVEG